MCLVRKGIYFHSYFRTQCFNVFVKLQLVVSGGVPVGAGGAVPYQEYSCHCHSICLVHFTRRMEGHVPVVFLMAGHAPNDRRSSQSC